MRIIVLGGSGVQGWQAAKTAAKRCSHGDSIIIVSRNQERASEAALRLENLGYAAEISHIVADLSLPDSLLVYLKAGDVVLNAAAPFFELGAIAAQAAINAGAHYFDICDDWEATGPILALHNEAVSKQIMAVTGLGAAPGLTSMLAIIAQRELDEVDQIVTAWPLSGGDGSQTLSIVPYLHFMQCCVGPIGVMRDGHFVDEEPLKPEAIILPGGEQLTGYTIGSPESVTLPIGIKTVRLSLALALISEQTAVGLQSLANAVRSEDISLQEAATFLQGSSGDEQSADDGSTPQICAVVIGTKNGQRATVCSTFSAWPDTNYTIAGIALGLAPSLLGQGALSGSGAFSIEHILTPETYLNALAREMCDGFEYRVSTEIAVIS